MKCHSGCLLICFILHLCSNAYSSQVVMISFDGFRYDYYETFDVKSLKSVAVEGVFAANGVKPVFPSKTFPNHWSLATGLYPESHGLVNNRFFDPDLNESFSMSKHERKWFKGEPIWSTAKRQGKRVAVFNWPGSEVDFGPNSPDVFVPYNKSVPLESLFDTIYGWLTVDTFDLALIYFHEPDGAGHKAGATSLLVKEEIEKIDEQLTNFMDKLDSNNYLETINVIIVSDHGMTNTTVNSTINLLKYNNLTANAHHIDLPREIVGVWPQPGKADSIYNDLKPVPHISVYYKEEIPDRFHYKSSNRIAPILIIADEGYVLTDNDMEAKEYKGVHGYDNDLPSMRSIFFARGPGIKERSSLTSYEAIDIYPLICHLLDIQPAPNNGSLDRSTPFMTSASYSLRLSLFLSYLMSCFSGFTVLNSRGM